MKVLAFDSGAKNLGWASVGSDPQPFYHLSGVLHLDRGETAYQKYRLNLSEELCYSIPVLLDVCEPDEVVTEIIPTFGFSNNAQAYLANVAATTIHTICILRGLPVYQIGANTVKSNIAIGGSTKVRVRNGVLKLLPELEDRKSSWTKKFDEPDAIAIALAHLGFKNTK